ncbi:LysE family translocator [Allopseudospirillum japonicum]|uniref:LysE family translocator n=1 Tax=Allopseudospirillum japonicum TaxID=64971 RepID=UPI001FE1BA37|nr:LysE family translocator [Allopseudospirillum japonicum]
MLNLELPLYTWQDFYLPLILFAFSMSATPGPNNLMLTASGANYGFKRTVPHMLGISVGFFLLLASVALGLGAIFTQWPQAHTGLKILGSVYLLWLAWKIANAPAPDPQGVPVGRPFNFMQAAAFQFANPKAWLMAIAAVTGFTAVGDAYLVSALWVGLICSLVNLPSISIWAGFGVAIGRILKSARHWQCFNWSMGALTASCVLMILA